jgi:hypothetical protein
MISILGRNKVGLQDKRPGRLAASDFGAQYRKKSCCFQYYICKYPLNHKCMTTITDEYMYEMLPKSKEYTIVLLKAGPRAAQPGFEGIVWEHGRRNFALRADGLLSVVCPVTIDADLSGLGIFNASIEETKKIMDEDPAVTAGIFIYELYPCRSFPGDSLPS